MFSNTRILLLDVFEGIFEKDSGVLQGFEGDSGGIWVHDIDDTVDARNPAPGDAVVTFPILQRVSYIQAVSRISAASLTGW